MEKTKYDLIKERGYVYQVTDEEAVKELINGKPITFYLGIDPTADSLHIGHFFALTMVRRLQKLGHKPVILVGGATGMIGDPSGRSDMRKMITKEQVTHNKNEIKKLVNKFVDLDGDNPAIIVDNADWINPYSYIDFMRDIGTHFNVNKMLATDAYKKRMEEGGLTFLEMGYMLMQAYDFEYLNKKYGCVLQVGGSDQWPNIIAGADLARKLDYLNEVDDRNLQGLTCPLLVKADGEKMGKTASGTLWISREKTTVYDFYQMFMNSYDEDVSILLAFFSDFEMDYIKEICKKDIREAKKIMAFEVTKLVHGEDEAIKVKEASEAIFSGKITDDIPFVELDKTFLKETENGLDILVSANLVPSKSEARRLIEQNGLTINQKKISDVKFSIEEKDLDGDNIIVQKGKKTFLKIIFK